jgi:hypothetical protein
MSKANCQARLGDKKCKLPQEIGKLCTTHHYQLVAQGAQLRLLQIDDCLKMYKARKNKVYIEHATAIAGKAVKVMPVDAMVELYSHLTAALSVTEAEKGKVPKEVLLKYRALGSALDRVNGTT